MKNKLISHMVYGYPNTQESQDILEILKKHSQYIEVQYPFSAPIADGITIQEANYQALSQNISPDTYFDFIKEWGKDNNLIIMTYFNILFRYGMENFMKKAQESNAYWLIVPDLPHDTPDFEELYKLSIAYNIHIILTVSPATESQRLKSIIEKSRGFVYAISQDMTTGWQSQFGDEFQEYIQRVQSQSDIPVWVWFGVSTPEHIQAVLQNADYPIIWSELLKQYKDHWISWLNNYLEEMNNSPKESS